MKELATILEQHSSWLKTDGVEGEKANLRNADLRNANLRNADLRNANLQSVDLYRANLRNADLRNANLYKATLQSADLRNADLYEATLQSANLRYANLYKANLRNANLRNATLRYANMEEANLRYANLRYVDLEEANLLYASLQYANLQDANLRYANLRYVDLWRTAFNGTLTKNSVLDPDNYPNSDCRNFERLQGGYVLGYRTEKAGHLDKYREGRVYAADVFSTCITCCHPGLYLWPTIKKAREWVYAPLIQVKTKAVDVHRTRTKYRCRWFEVVRKVGRNEIDQ